MRAGAEATTPLGAVVINMSTTVAIITGHRARFLSCAIDKAPVPVNSQCYSAPVQFAMPPSVKESLRRIVESSDTPAARRFDYVIQMLVLISVVTFTLETLPNTSATLQTLFTVTEIGLVALFSIEYLLRIWVAEARWRFIFSFYGIIDLVAIMPFYLALGFDLRALRAVRFLRLFKILTLPRYSQALERLSIALRLAREELLLFFVLSVVAIYLAAIGIYYFERTAQPDAFSSVPAAMWWAVVTLTTVGYGDIYPITVGGKVFTGAILFVGVGLIAVPAGIIASAISKARELNK